MNQIKYVTGDATRPPVSTAPSIIAHICNDVGAWGAGFVLALSKRNTIPEDLYLEWYRRDDMLPQCMNPYPPFQLGEIMFAPFEGLDQKNTYVCNMIAQRDAPGKVDYNALQECLLKLQDVALDLQASIHMPRIGCGLGGGKWDEVQKIIQRTLCAYNIPVTVYDLP